MFSIPSGRWRINRDKYFNPKINHELNTIADVDDDVRKGFNNPLIPSTKILIGKLEIYFVDEVV